MKSFGISGGTRDAVSRCDARSTWNNVGKTCYSKCFTGEPDALKGARRVRIGVRGTPRAYYTTHPSFCFRRGSDIRLPRHSGGGKIRIHEVDRVLQLGPPSSGTRLFDAGGHVLLHDGRGTEFDSGILTSYQVDLLRMSSVSYRLRGMKSGFKGRTTVCTNTTVMLSRHSREIITVVFV